MVYIIWCNAHAHVMISAPVGCLQATLCSGFADMHGPNETLMRQGLELPSASNGLLALAISMRTEFAQNDSNNKKRK